MTNFRKLLSTVVLLFTLSGNAFGSEIYFFKASERLKKEIDQLEVEIFESTEENGEITITEYFTELEKPKDFTKCIKQANKVLNDDSNEYQIFFVVKNRTFYIDSTKFFGSPGIYEFVYHESAQRVGATLKNPPLLQFHRIEDEAGNKVDDNYVSLQANFSKDYDLVLIDEDVTTEIVDTDEDSENLLENITPEELTKVERDNFDGNRIHQAPIKPRRR